MPVVNVLVGGVTHERMRGKAKIDGSSAEWVVYEFEPPHSTVASSGSLSPDGQDMVSAEITGLDPGTLYRHGIYVDGQFDNALAGTFFTHPAAPGQPASFMFAVSSCAAGSNDPGSGGIADPPRISNHRVFEDIMERQPEPLFFAHLGDFHYYDLGSGNHDISGGASLENYRSGYDDVLLQPRQQNLYRNMALIYAWDDHDYGPNNSDGTHSGKDNAATAYREKVPSYDLPESGDPDEAAIYQSFQVGRVLFILSDTRYHRSPNGDPDDASKTMLGSDQKAWMNDLLSTNADDAEALIWLCPTPWMGGAVDTWNGFTTERAELSEMFFDLGWMNRMASFNGDYHGLAIDSGAGNLDRDGGPASFPVWVCGSLDSLVDSNPGNPTFQYDRGPTHPGSAQYVTVDVRDRGFAIEIRGTAWRRNRGWRTYQLTVPVEGGTP